VNARFPLRHALGLLLVAAPAAAAPHAPAELALERGADAGQCIDAAHLVSSVERRLHRKVFYPEAKAELRLTVRLLRRAEAWVAEISLADALGQLGERELTTRARHCSALDDSLALIVSLLVDTPPERPSELAKPSAPSRAAASKAAEPTSRPNAPPTASPRATPLEIPAETLAPREPWQIDAGVGVFAGYGLLPELAFGPELMAGFTPPRGPLFRVVGDFSLPKESSLDGRAAGVRVSIQRLGLDVCAKVFTRPVLEVSLCAGQRLARVRSSGFGFVENRDDSRVVLSLAAGADALIPLGRYLGIALGAGGEALLNRLQFVVIEANGTQGVAESSRTAGIVRIGLAGRI
jgi:hypothetical protein